MQPSEGSGTRLAPIWQDPLRSDLRPGRMFMAVPGSHTHSTAALSREETHISSPALLCCPKLQRKWAHKTGRGRPGPWEGSNGAVRRLSVPARAGPGSPGMPGASGHMHGLVYGREKRDGFGAGFVQGRIQRKPCPLLYAPSLSLRSPSLPASASLRASRSSLFSTAGGGLKYYKGGARNAPRGPAPMARAQT